MTGTVSLTLPWGVSANASYVPVRGRMVLSNAARQAKITIAQQVLVQLGPGRRPVFSGSVRVEITAYPPRKGRIDVDNKVKPLLDALTYAGLWHDDVQVERVVVERGAVVKGGALFVRIVPLVKVTNVAGEHSIELAPLERPEGPKISMK